MRSTRSRSLSARTATVFGLAVLALFATIPLSAQEIAHTQFFPILARTAGAGGTQWVTDMTVHNHSDNDLVVGVFSSSKPTRPTSSTRAFPTRFTLGARETRLFTEDASTSSSVSKPISRARWWSPSIRSSYRAPATRSARRSSPRPGPTTPATRPAPTARPSRPLGRVINAARDQFGRHGGDQQHPIPVQSRRHEPDVHRRPQIKIRVLDAARRRGLPVKAKTLLPASVSQWSLQSLGVPKATVRSPSSSGCTRTTCSPIPVQPTSRTMFIAYVSKVDGNPDGTGDAEFIYAAPNDPYDCQYQP